MYTWCGTPGGGIPERFEAGIMLRKALKSMVVVQGDLITEYAIIDGHAEVPVKSANRLLLLKYNVFSHLCTHA
ncbi:hypothetical protein [Pantoea ananatis]|uniref:hypothetical protein n=1 Tax=Pantoea ananas TaxID=553 RepID=UPI0011B581D2|nr:hypothetical protein [Pantoea ananatis]USL60505.1 hypothetical protein IAQ00_22885 [Pantoea ananatis]